MMTSFDPFLYKLDNGLTAVMQDESSHYFGGYFHVKLLVSVEILLKPSYFSSLEIFEDACSQLGEVVNFTRTLEKMAVPKEELEPVKNDLRSYFVSNLLPYLNRPDFPKATVLYYLEKKFKKRRNGSLFS